MKLDKMPAPDLLAAAGILGYGAAPDAAVQALLERAAAALAEGAQARWTYAAFALDEPLALRAAGVALPGRDIARHLAGCTGCLLLAVTLGDGAEVLTRAAQATDMAYAVALDAVASTWVEQCADVAQCALETQMARRGQYLTGRYSPGYGDLPLALQKDFIRLLDAPRAIGLTVADSGILLPRKSITAVLGVADHAVTGHLAGCENCALRGRCEWYNNKSGGKACGKPDF